MGTPSFQGCRVERAAPGGLGDREGALGRVFRHHLNSVLVLIMGKLRLGREDTQLVSLEMGLHLHGHRGLSTVPTHRAVTVSSPRIRA